MPNLMALVIATLVAWIVRDALPTARGLPLPTLIALCVWIAVFPVAKRMLQDLRPSR